MIIVGAKPAQHDACFALVRDGEPLFIYEQERFNRIKHGMSCELSVLFDGLREHGIDPGEVDLVTNCMDPGLVPERNRQTRTFMRGEAIEAMDAYVNWRLPIWHRVLVAAGFDERKILDVRHHVCHCAGVYYASPFDDA